MVVALAPKRSAYSGRIGRTMPNPMRSSATSSRSCRTRAGTAFARSSLVAPAPGKRSAPPGHPSNQHSRVRADARGCRSRCPRRPSPRPAARPGWRRPGRSPSRRPGLVALGGQRGDLGGDLTDLGVAARARRLRRSPSRHRPAAPPRPTSPASRAAFTLRTRSNIRAIAAGRVEVVVHQRSEAIHRLVVGGMPSRADRRPPGARTRRARPANARRDRSCRG